MSLNSQPSPPITGNPEDTPRSGDGCGFVLLTFLFICAALIFNGMLVTGLYFALLGGLKQRTFFQLLAFALPLVALFIQWWLLDWFVDWSSPHDPDA